MNGILTKEGYKIAQHEVTNDLLIMKDGRILQKVEVSRPLKTKELLDIFEFIKQTDAWKGECQ